MYHGYGTLEMASGTKYEGEFRENEYHGYGTLTYHDGQVQSGRWENSTFIGD